jgi:hypothetical protein
MTTYELLATVAGLGGLVAAIGGLAVSAVSFRRTRKLDSQQSRLQVKQVELTELQLELTKKQSAGLTASGRSADVRVALEGFSPNYRFVITNWGEAPARDVRVDITALNDRPSPLVRGDYDEKMPIPALAVGARCSLLAAITFSTGTVFKASWEWTNPDGTTQQRESQLTLP